MRFIIEEMDLIFLPYKSSTSSTVFKVETRQCQRTPFSYATNRTGFKVDTTSYAYRTTTSTKINESGFLPNVIEMQLAQLKRKIGGF